MDNITFPQYIIIVFALIILIVIIFSSRGEKCPHRSEKYSLGVNYADPRLIPEYPTYDHLAHSNVWTRYDLESDKDIYSPYFPCWDCAGDSYWKNKGWGTLGAF